MRGTHTETFEVRDGWTYLRIVGLAFLYGWIVGVATVVLFLLVKP